MTSVSKAVWLAAGLSLWGLGHAWADVKVGVAGPLTGSSAAFGEQLRRGAEKAAADINRSGGILGQTIAISLGDDAGDPKQGVSVANKFASEGIKLVIGISIRA